MGFLLKFEKNLKNPVTFRGGLRLLIQRTLVIGRSVLGGFWKEALGKK